MKYNFSLFLFLLVCFAIVTMNHVKKHNDSSTGNYSVRVLLVEYDLDKDIPDRLLDQKDGDQQVSKSACLVNLKSKNGFLLSDGTKESKVFYSKSDVISVTVKNHFIYINDKKYLRDRVKISPKDGDIKFGENFYQGDFIFILDKKKLLVINKIDLEDYVFAVLCSESWPGWPLEVNKVFAVAIRTYVTKRAQDAKRANRLYHIKNDNSHQTYKGHKVPNCDYALMRKAVAKTDDLILTYKGDIIDPLYDCCCGGVIPAHIEGKINFKKAPYLARNYPCPYCKKCNLYKWQVSYSIKDLEALLNIKDIRSITVTKKDKAGLVKEAKIKSGNHIIKISGDKIYKELKRIKSFCFSLKKKGDALIVNGRGYGHHVGICQWGARQMVRENFDFKQILAFYYPGTHLSDFPRN